MGDTWNTDLRGCKEEIRALKQELQSQSQKPRKDGLKRLRSLLGSPYVRVLDRETIKLDVGDEVPTMSWPGLCALFMPVAQAEVASAKSSKRKGADSAVSECFRKLIETAEDSKKRSCGQGGMLILKAAKIYRHACEILQVADGTDSQIGQDYSRTLLKHLLVNQEYMAHLTSPTAHEFLELSIGRVKDRGLSLEEDSRTASAMVLHIVQGMTCDMRPSMQRRMLTFLRSSLGDLYSMRRDPRLGNSHVTINVLSCLNSFLLRNGPDVRSASAKIHMAAHPLVMWCFKNDTLRLEDILVTYLRIQMRLGGLFGVPGALNDVYEALQARVGSGKFSWLAGVAGDPVVQRPGMLELVAATCIHANTAASAGDDADGNADKEEEPRRGKSARRETSLESLVSSGVTSPLLWLPVSAMLLRQYGSHLEPDTLDLMLRKTAQCFQSAPVQAELLQEPSDQLQGVIWRLWFVAELADHQARQSLAGAGPQTTSQDGNEEHWQGFWELALQLVQHPSSSDGLFRAALVAAEALVRQRLVRPGSPGSVLQLEGAQADQDSATGMVTKLLRSSEGVKFVTTILQASGTVSEMELQNRTVIFKGLVASLKDESSRGAQSGCADLPCLCRLALALLDCSLPPGTLETASDLRPGFPQLLSGDSSETRKAHTAAAILWLTSSNDCDLHQQLELLQCGEDFLDKQSQPEVHAYQSGSQESGARTAFTASMARKFHGAAASELSETLASVSPDGQLLLGGLHQSFLATAVSAVCMAAVSRCSHYRHALPDDWADGSQLQARFGRCLRACGRALAADASASAAALPEETRQSLRALVAALNLRPIPDASAWCNGLLTEMEAAFTSNVWDKAAEQGASESGAGDPMLDDDLDFMPRTTLASADSSEGRNASKAVRMKQLRIARDVASLASDGAAVAYSRIIRWIEHTQDSAAFQELLDALFTGLCEAACAGSLCALTTVLDLMKHRISGVKVTEPRFMLFLNILKAVTDALAKAPEADEGACFGGKETRQQVMLQLQETSRMIGERMEAEEKFARKHNGGSMAANWMVRTQHAATVAALIDLKAAQFGSDENRDTVERLVSDPCYCARREAAKIVQVFFRQWPYTNAIFGSIQQHLAFALQPTPEGTKPVLEHEESSILVAMQTAIDSPALELEVLYLLAAHAAHRPIHRHLVAAAVCRMASSLGYNDPAMYLDVLRLPLSWRWVAESQDPRLLLEILPVLLGQEDQGTQLSPQLKPWAVSLLPPVLLFTRSDDYAFLSSLTSDGPESPLKDTEYLGLLFGELMLLLEGEQSEQQATTEVAPGHPEHGQAGMVLSAQDPILVAQGTTPEELDRLADAARVEIVMQMLILAAPADGGSPPPLPLHGLDMVLKAIRSWDHGNKQGEVWDWLPATAIPRLLSCVHERLESTRHPRHRVRALAAVQALMGLLGDRLKEPFVFVYMCHMLATGLQESAMQQASAGVLQDLLRAVLHPLNESLELSVIQHKLRELISTCAEGLSRMNQGEDGACMPGAAEASGEEPLQRLLVQLTSEAPDCVQELLADMAPVPDNGPILSDVRKLQSSHKATMTFEQQVVAFAEAARGQSPLSRQKSVASLLEALRQLPSVSQAGSDNIQGAAWELASLGVELNDSTVSCLAAQLLAICGPLPPTAVAFTPPDHGGGATGPRQAEGSAKGKRRRRSAGDAPNPMLPAVLESLVPNLTDEKLAVIKDTHTALLRLLGDIDPGKIEHLTNPSNAALLALFCGTAVPDAPVEQVHNPCWALENRKLWDPSGQPYARWVCHLAYALIMHCQDPALKACARIVKTKEATAEALMPLIFCDLACVDTDDGQLMKIISTQVTKKIIRQESWRPSASKAMRLVLLCLECLRSCWLDATVGYGSAAAGSSEWCDMSKHMASRGVDFSDWDTVFWLKLNQIEVAAAAVACSATFTALIHLEAAFETQEGFRPLAQTQDSSAGASAPANAEGILLEVFSNINEPDNISAVESLCREPWALLQVYGHRGDWAGALGVADRTLQAHPTAAASHQLASAAQSRALPLSSGLWSHILQALNGMACQTTADACLAHCVSAMSSGSSEGGAEAIFGLRDRYFESAWRAGQWSKEGPGGSLDSAKDGMKKLLKGVSTDPGFHESLAMALSALRQGDAIELQGCVETARVQEIGRLVSAGVQSATALNESIVKLQMVGQIEQAWEVFQCEDCHSRQEAAQGFRATWAKQRKDAVSGGRFALVEPLVVFNSVLLQALGCTSDAVVEVQLEGVRAARKARQLSWAGTTMAKVRAEAGAPSAGAASASAVLARPDAEWHLEDVKVLWAEGHRELAMRLAKGLADGLGSVEGANLGLAARSHILTAKWLEQEGAGGPSAILDHMERACELAEGCGDQRVACKSHFHLAEYAFNLYRGAVAQQSSPETATRMAVLRAKQKQLDEIMKQIQQLGTNVNNQTAARGLALHRNRKQREINLDSQELNALESRKREYLMLALSNYRQVLALGNQYDLMAVFRLCNLWFKLGDKEVNAQVAEAFDSAPSHKFLTLVYQMASRMSSATTGALHASGFYKVLHKMMHRLAVDHPYHTLYQVFALKNGNRASQSSRGLHHNVDAAKVAAADALIGSLRRAPKVAAIVKQMETMLELYIKLAELATPKNNNTGMSMPREFRHGLKDLHLMPLVSVGLPVNPGGDYSAGSFAHIQSVSDSISFVGGVNKPKLIKVFDSEGLEHKELVKSRDDLRQDAVMQQLFALVNELLQQDESSRIRQLCIATYKVVPITPDSGLLGWVDNTMPLAEYLVGKGGKQDGAHTRYRGPMELRNIDAHKMMSEARQKGSGHREQFDKICSRFFPVMHHFFLEMYRHPSEWFERRLAYTRSVAVNSMVGYIIGLGDRHSSNILIKMGSAEVVHIDLGIAFEQGRLLPTPEQVPFRLTRDIVDGMGVTGCEGVMRRCSEVVLRLLRAHRDELLTIAEVLIHDPLYNWALTPKQAARQQRRTGDSSGAGEEEDLEDDDGVELGNIDAERALTRVRQKLEGTELGDGEPRSVEGQTQMLLQAAQDPDKLCRMYEGWAAWV